MRPTRLIRTLGIALALASFLAAPASAQDRRTTISAPRVDFPVLDRRWAQFQAATGGSEGEREKLTDFHETALELGLLELPAHALVLMQQAAAADEAGDRARAEVLTDWAEMLSPSSPQPDFFRARQTFFDSPWALGDVFSHVRDGYEELGTTPTGRAAVGRQWRGVVVRGGLIFSLLFGLFIALRHGTALAHDLRIALVKTLTLGQSTALVALLLGAAPLLFWSPFAFVVSAFFVCALHMNLRERLVGALVLALCASAPILTAQEARLVAESQNNNSRIVNAIVSPCNERCSQLLEVALERDGRQEAALVTAWNEYKRGTPDRLRRASEMLEGLELSRGARASAEVLLGNIQFVEGDLEGAEEHYLEAHGLASNSTQRAVAHYALYRLHSAADRSRMQESSLLSARAEDADFVANYIDYTGRSQNRVLPICPIPPESLQTSTDSGSQVLADAAANELLKGWYGAIPVSVTLPIVFLILFLLVIGVMANRMRLVSRRCGRCATPVSRWVLDQAFRESLCILCFQLDHASAHLRREQRDARQARIDRWAEAVPKLVLATNLLAPGGGLVMAGWTLTGSFFAAIYSAALAVLVADTIVDATPYTLPESSLFDGRVAVAAIVLGFVYLATGLLSFKAGTIREPS
jgi:hypothetical protein